MLNSSSTWVIRWYCISKFVSVLELETSISPAVLVLGWYYQTWRDNNKIDVFGFCRNWVGFWKRTYWHLKESNSSTKNQNCSLQLEISFYQSLDDNFHLLILGIYSSGSNFLIYLDIYRIFRCWGHCPVFNVIDTCLLIAYHIMPCACVNWKSFNLWFILLLLICPGVV